MRVFPGFRRLRGFSRTGFRHCDEWLTLNCFEKIKVFSRRGLGALKGR